MLLRYIPYFLVLLLTACQPEPVEKVEPIVRAVKLFTINEVDQEQERAFSGTSVAKTSSSLSFPLSGKVVDVLINSGEKVVKGQELARLDATTYERERNIAVAESRQARVTFEDKKGDYSRKKPLGDTGVITQRELEEAKAAMLSAQEQLNLSRTKLRITEDNLDDTVLKSPFDGVISDRSVEPFVEVTSGQQLFLLENQGAIEVEIAVHENFIGRITLGQSANVTFNSIPDTLIGHVTEIAAAADVGNVFTVKVTLDDIIDGLYSGLSAQVMLSLESNSTVEGHMIPLSSLLAGKGNGGGDYVFVLNETTNTMKKTAVTHVFNAVGNYIAVEGLVIGDRVASAGVSFLSDGQLVKPYQSAP